MPYTPDPADPTAPQVADLNVEVDAAAQAVSALGAVVEVPFAGTVTDVSVVAGALLTGANTDSRTIQVVNKGQAGGGATVVASKAFVAGVNAAADAEVDLTLSVVAGATTVAEGDVLEVQSLAVGAGLASPRFQAKIKVARVG